MCHSNSPLRGRIKNGVRSFLKMTRLFNGGCGSAAPWRNDGIETHWLSVTANNIIVERIRYHRVLTRPLYGKLWFGTIEISSCVLVAITVGLVISSHPSVLSVLSALTLLTSSLAKQSALTPIVGSSCDSSKLLIGCNPSSLLPIIFLPLFLLAVNTSPHRRCAMQV